MTESSASVRESYEEMDVYHLGTIYGLPNIDVVGHVQSTVTSALSRKMVTVLGATILIVQKKKAEYAMNEIEELDEGNNRQKIWMRFNEGGEGEECKK